MHQRHVIYACYFVKSVCMESAPERQAALYSVARNSIIFFNLFFPPPSVPWIEVTSEQSAGNLCRDGNCNVPCFMGLQVKMICVHAGV